MAYFLTLRPLIIIQILKNIAVTLAMIVLFPAILVAAVMTIMTQSLLAEEDTSVTTSPVSLIHIDDIEPQRAQIVQTTPNKNNWKHLQIQFDATTKTYNTTVLAYASDEARVIDAAI